MSSHWNRFEAELMNLTMISYVNSFILAGIQPWFLDILHSTELIDDFINDFIYDFIYMNSAAWILRWIHIYEFWCMISQYFLWSWIQIWIHIMNPNKISWSWIHMLHFMTYEFRYEFMCTKNIVKSYLKSWVPLSWQGSRWYVV